MPTPVTRKFIQQSLLNNNLGAQTTPEGGTVADDRDGDALGGGKFRHFRGGSIYWREDLGAHVVQGAIKAKFAELGFEHNTSIGFPIGDEKPGIARPENRWSEFEQGVIYFRSDTHVAELLRPVEIADPLITGQVSTIVMTALGRTMVGDLRLGNTVVPRIISIRPYRHFELPHPLRSRPFSIFTWRCAEMQFDVLFTGPQDRITMRCTILLELKTNMLGQLVFVLRDFQFDSDDVRVRLLRPCIGGSIDDQVLPMCNVEHPVILPALPSLPPEPRILAAHFNTPMLAGTTGRHSALLFVEPT